MPADKKPDVVADPRVVDQAGGSPGPPIANIIIGDGAGKFANEDGARGEKAPEELPKADSGNGRGANRHERNSSSTPSQGVKPQTVDKKETSSQEPIQQKPSKSSTSKE